MSPPNEKGRPPAANREDGPQAKTTISNIISIAPGAADSWSLDGLPSAMRTRVQPDPVSGCWIGSAPYFRDGYARWRQTGLHRAVWLQLVGPIPDGLVLDHVQKRGCMSRACCWPGHLEPVTPRVNVLRGSSFAAVNARKDRCDNGHEFDLMNTYFRPNGHRDCRACIRSRVAKYQRRARTERTAAPGELGKAV